MSETKRERDHLATHGKALIDQGYSIVPIQVGKKAPGFDGWQKSKANAEQLHQWLEGGFKSAGVGILTKVTCAIDIDSLDEETALLFERWCLDEIGPAPVRIGKAPKRLLVYRTEEPFSKRSSAKYVDEWGDNQQIEILGNGQQFVAFHIHPDTGKPYTWVDGKSPLNIRANDLTLITQDQISELIDAFETHAAKMQWSLLKKGREPASGNIDTDNPWAEDSSPITISDEELRSRLLLVPGADDYDQWFRIGMALHHQYDGEQTGFDLWNEWSETADNYDHDALQRHWPSFAISGKGRAPLTARLIIRLAKEHVEKTAMEQSVKLRDAFINAKDLAEWEKARQMAREAEIDGLARSALAVVAKDRRDAITGSKTALAEIKKAISFMPKKVERTPKWCEDWVYDVSDDRFFNLKKKIATTKQGFDAMHDRYALTKKDVLDGAVNATNAASALALNLYRIPTVDGRRYMPGRDPISHEPDGTFCNTYPEHEIPEPPDKEVPRDRRNVDRVKAHIAHLLSSEKEQRMLLDWMSWVVQNPGRHVNYAVLLQGVEGDGKSFFAELLRSVMGVSNVSMANAATVTRFNFTNWAYGQCVCCIEEIRLVSTMGQDKWDAINKIKPFITNSTIEVRPLGKAAFNTFNTTSYMLFSNYRDALPLDDNSRRFLVLFSKWQRREDIVAFKEEHPDYYTRLYGALTESAGALRQWLLKHEQESSFNPMGDAPDTSARRVMIRKSKSEFIQVLDDVIAEDETVEASHDLLDVTGLSDVMMMRGVEWPGPKALATILEREGWECLGKVRLGDAVHKFYSRHPDSYTNLNPQGVRTTDTAAVRKAILSRRNRLDDDL